MSKKRYIRIGENSIEDALRHELKAEKKMRSSARELWNQKYSTAYSRALQRFYDNGLFGDDYDETDGYDYQEGELPFDDYEDEDYGYGVSELDNPKFSHVEPIEDDDYYSDSYDSYDDGHGMYDDDDGMDGWDSEYQMTLGKQIYFYETMNKDVFDAGEQYYSEKFNCIRELRNYCDQMGIRIPHAVMEELKYRQTSYCTFDPQKKSEGDLCLVCDKAFSGLFWSVDETMSYMSED